MIKQCALALFTLLLVSCNGKAQEKETEVFPVQKTEAEWKAELTEDQYYILREEGTERPFSSELNKIYSDGTYKCAGCGTPVFESKHKFNSGTGWPSFLQPAEGSAVLEHSDDSWGMRRVEVLCSACGGHLGHVFEDGPRPTGLRYCINSAALKFVADSADVQGVKYD